MMAPQTLAYVVGAGVPVLVALVTKRYAQPWVKVAVNLVTTALVAALAHLGTADGRYDLAGFWGAFVAALTASVLAYVAVLKHTLVRLIEAGTGDWGLGAAIPEPAAHPVGDPRGVVALPFPPNHGFPGAPLDL